MVCQEADWLSWTLIQSLGGVEGCPSVEVVSLGCGVMGRFPRGGDRGAAAGPALEFRLTRQHPATLLISARRVRSEGSKRPHPERVSEWKEQRQTQPKVNRVVKELPLWPDPPSPRGCTIWQAVCNKKSRKVRTERAVG